MNYISRIVNYYNHKNIYVTFLFLGKSPAQQIMLLEQGLNMHYYRLHLVFCDDIAFTYGSLHFPTTSVDTSYSPYVTKSSISR
jgi:hypothetical protein